MEFRGIETPQLPKPVQQRSVEAEKSRSQGVEKCGKMGPGPPYKELPLDS